MANSLYDSYKLSNSAVVPMFQGSSAPEALLVGKHLQGMYDMAKDGAFKVLEGSDGLSAMGADQQHLEKVRNKITGDIKQMSDAGDWENQVDPVRGLGRYYVARARELAAPVQQYQKWAEEKLNNKDLNLTPEQKRIIDARALAGYKGLQDDGTGRLVGGFSGIEPAKNIDVAELSDKLLKDRVIQEGGTDFSSDNGIVKYKVGKEWKVMPADRVSAILREGLALNQEYKAYKQMEGDNAAFMAQQRYRDISQVPPHMRANVEAAMNQGYSFEQAVGGAANMDAQDQISIGADNYVRQKYHQNNQWTTNESGIGEIAKAQAIKEAETDNTTRLVMDDMDVVATDFENLNKDRESNVQLKNAAVTRLEAAKNTVMRSYEAKNGAGSWSQLGNNAREDAIRAHYNDPSLAGGSGLYAQLQQDRATIGAADAKLNKIKEAQDIAENYVLQLKHGTTKHQLSKDIQTDLSTSIGKMGTKKIPVILDGKRVELPATELAGLIKDGTYNSASDQGSNISLLPAMFHSSVLNLKTKDGRSLHIVETAVKGKVDDLVMKYGKYGQNIQNEVKQFGEEAMKQYAQNTAIVVTNNKKINELADRSIKAGSKILYDAGGNKLEAGTDEYDELTNLINAGEFEQLGIRTETKDGRPVYKIAVRDKQDKDAAPKTILVGVNLNASDVSNQMMREAMDKQGNIRYPELYNAARALLPGSSYNQINKSKLNDKVAEVLERRLVKQPDGTSKVEFVPIFFVDKARPNEKPGAVVRRPDGTQLSEFTDQLQIGASLDEYRSNPNYKVIFK